MPSFVERIFPGVAKARQDLEEAKGFYDRHTGRIVEWERSIQDKINHANDILLSGSGGDADEAMRLEMVAGSRQLVQADPIAAWAIKLWRAFGFGSNISIAVEMKTDAPMPKVPDAPDDQGPDTTTESARAIIAEVLEDVRKATAGDWFSEFWGATRNMPVLKNRRLHKLSDRLLRDGEFYFVFFIGTNGDNAGRTTVRTVLTDQITELVRSEDDDDEVLWFKRVWFKPGGERMELYYPNYTKLDTPVGERDDKMLPQGAKRIDKDDPTTDVVMLQVAWNEDDRQRGWPLLTTGLDWIRQLQISAQDLTAILATNAMYARTLKHKAGSRGTAALKTKLQSRLATYGEYNETNPPPIAGSVQILNDAVDESETPLNKTASESTNTLQLLKMMASLSAGLFPHYIGSGESFRLATASSMEEPLRRQWTQYKLFWADVFNDIVNIVLNGAELYASKDWPLEDRDVDVVSDSLWTVSLTDFASAMETLGDFIPDKRLLTQLVLQALRIDDIGELLDEYYPPGEDTTPEPKQVPPVMPPGYAPPPPVPPEIPASELGRMEGEIRLAALDGRISEDDKDRALALIETWRGGVWE